MTLSQQFPDLMMPVKVIPLTHQRFTIIDPEDWELASYFPWYAHKGQDAYSWYAITLIGRHKIPLHMLLTRSRETDHINGNGLDNRRVNLRGAKHYLNIANQGKRTSRTAVIYSSRFKGVTWDKNRARWIARITVQGKGIHLGRFEEETEAAKAYDNAAIQHFGQFARTNKQLGLL